MAKIIEAIPAKNFKDAGTKKLFTEGKKAEFTEGEYANYLRAGLLKAPEADKKSA